MSMRSGQPGINGNEYASFEFKVPPTLNEQTSIATILNDMDAEVAALETKLSKARQIKQSMMQELLTGRIRLI
jgi:type I restriction enzyme S subunit